VSRLGSKQINRIIEYQWKGVSARFASRTDIRERGSSSTSGRWQQRTPASSRAKYGGAEASLTEE
jgi:hypothetical protein